MRKSNSSNKGNRDSLTVLNQNLSARKEKNTSDGAIYHQNNGARYIYISRLNTTKNIKAPPKEKVTLFHHFNDKILTTINTMD